MMKLLKAVVPVFLGLASQTFASLPPREIFQARSLEEFITLQQNHKLKRQETNRSNLGPNGRRIEELESSEIITADLFGGSPGFYHGVASGDPLVDRVILWTRYTPVAAGESVTLELRLAKVDPNLAVEDHLDPNANANVKVAKIETSEDSDYVAKVDVLGLESNTHYVFAFTDGKTSSEVGQTRTAPSMEDEVDEMTYAFFSCAHFSNGYFHAYDVASTIENIDFWIHLGDYVYEYGAYGTYATDIPERRDMTLPSWEMVELQDYRNRFATYHQWDEGLRNIRRRAPVIQIWDDHELTNNAYGQESGPVGAENHQEVCSANRTSTNEDKAEAQCDRDEGDAKIRFNEAAQAYMEWMPIRQGPMMPGVLEFTSITQVIEWGDLASIVAVDSRLGGRSAEPTIADTFTPFAAATLSNLNISAYYDEASDVRQLINVIAQSTKAEMSNPAYSMLGEENRNLILDTFESSKAAGKPWQIFAAATVMGPQVPINMDKMSDYAPAAFAPSIQGFTDAVLTDPSAFLLRIGVAMDVSGASFSPDAFDGFAYEREILLDGFQEKANNPIVLSGDSHDSWAFTLYEKGTLEEGNPVAVNLGCPGVTSPGWNGLLGDVLTPLSQALGGALDVHKLASDTFVGRNSGMKYNDILRKGFVAVKATKDTHTAEYILFEPEVILTDYDEAREASGKITAAFTCGVSLVTKAEDAGSLDAQEDCVVTFDSTRHLVWDIPVPISGDGSLGSGKSLTECGFNACEFDTTDEATDEAPSSGSKKFCGFVFFVMVIMLFL